MVSKKCHITMIKLFAVLFLLINSVFFIHAQNSLAAGSDFYVERRFVQRLSWTGNEYASRYEVIIEKEEAGRFLKVYQNFTTAFSVDVSLPPGMYRYCVIPYDFLGRPGTGTEWMDFEIFTAALPKLFFSVPELYLSGNNYPVFSKEYVLMIYGADISPHAEIFIRVDNGRIVFPDNLRIDYDRSGARLVFDDIHKIPQIFDVVVRNPGDLEASMRTRSYITSPPDKIEARHIFDELGIMPDSLKLFFGIKDDEETKIKRKLFLRSNGYFGWFIAAGYTPLFSVFDNIVFMPDAVISLPACALKISFIKTAENSFFGFGMEAAASFFSFNTVLESVHNVNALEIGANLIVQKQTFNRKMAFKFRFGAGYAILFGDAIAINILDANPFNLNIGTAFVWFAAKHFYIETGVDMVCWILNKNTSGAIRPSVCIGLRF